MLPTRRHLGSTYSAFKIHFPSDVPEDLKEDPVKFWNYFKEFKDAAGESRFINLAQLAFALYALCYSNAEVEHIFSKMNHFKSKVRNKMASPTTDALVCVEVNAADDFVLDDKIFD